jgi:hypothetical protein
MALEQAIDRTFVNIVPYALLKRETNDLSGDNFTAGSLFEKWRQKGTFFFY